MTRSGTAKSAKPGDASPPRDLAPSLPRYRTVLQALAEADVHADVMARFRVLGGKHLRWERRDVIAMADAITAVEDTLPERMTEARVVLRRIRRRCEEAIE